MATIRSNFPVPPAVPVAGRLAAALLFATAAAAAKEEGAPAPQIKPGEPLSLMNALARSGLHHIKDESWDAYGQFTYISSSRPPFPAPYTTSNRTNNPLMAHR